MTISKKSIPIYLFTIFVTIPKQILSDLQKSANIACGLAMDTVANAQSGHLGLPLGCAEIGAALFGYLLHLFPNSPRWINRDRFILSAGHATSFLYPWLFLSGFPLDPLPNFRTYNSNLPGHPEFSLTPGIESTTGPLGQGLANAVGFAISEKMQQSRLKNIAQILDYHIVCLCGDGCLQEGISHEACSLAGHLRLDNLILIYDSNGITLDTSLNKTQSDNVKQRFEAYKFFVQEVDGHNIAQFIEAYQQAILSDCPNLIIAKTIIGHGIDEVAGTSKAHGEIGIKFIREAKEKLGLPDRSFFISDEVKLFFKNRRKQWAEEYHHWEIKFDAWKKENKEQYVLFFSGQDTDYSLSHDICKENDAISTREIGGKILNKLAEKNPRIITGSADLFSSCKNYLFQKNDFNPEDWTGRNISFGIREHAMGAILNGIAYDGIFQPSGSTFLVFSDYLRPAIRIAAMAKLPVVYIFTHDSIAIGQDGPTHQPVETLAALRAIPNLDVIRPANAEECVGAYQAAFLRKDGPTALILSRQNLPILSKVANRRNGTICGAYIAHDATDHLRLIVIGTGSELSLALEAVHDFTMCVRVVSMPSMEIFERQNAEYKEKILPSSCPLRLAIEAGVAMPWYRYVGSQGKIIAVDDFGLSAPGKQVQVHFGLTVEHIRSEIKSLFITWGSAPYPARG
ncbi:MAG: transketolase [Puniceicoccales bacterium]|nr:transketolase [Puniceicoccales bacterium]